MTERILNPDGTTTVEIQGAIDAAHAGGWC